jgi:colanic acid biosynthesis glycosyl transferase WcaI
LGITRTRVMPNWADTVNLVPQRTADSKLRRDLGLQDRFVIGYSGNFGRAHEFQTLLGAARLLRQDPRFVFLMTGGGARMRELKDAVKHDGLDNFVFRGYQQADRLCDALTAADVHLVSLLPALDGLIVPSKVYGILAVGRPVIFIGSADNDLVRMIGSHECGVAITVGDGMGLATQLRALRDAPLRLQAMGANARRLAETRYSSARAAEDWVRLLEAMPDPARRIEATAR